MRTALLVAVAVLIASSSGAQTPNYSKAAATVLVFTTTDCPISNRYAPEIKRLAQAFRARGVEFLLVYPVPGDTPAIIKQHETRFEYGLSFTRDTRQDLVKFARVKVTPEVAVVNRGGTIVYRGRIDDRYIDLGRERTVVTMHDLEDALNAVVAGKPVRVAQTPAVGCYLPDLIK